jgi:NAD(P)H-quinone oxidoreductase subunit 4
MFYTHKGGSIQLLKTSNLVYVTKFVLVLELAVFFVINLFIFFIFVSLLKFSLIDSIISRTYNFSYYNYNIPINLFSFDLSIDIVGLIFSNLAFFVGFLSLLCLDTRFFWNNYKFIFVCNIIVLSVLFFTLTNNFFLFFLMYELLLIPSFFFVYFVSPGKQAIQASIYFVIWTQAGSFLVFLAICILLSILGSSSFDAIRNFNFTSTEQVILMNLLFFGFGFKIPVWPFHYWITKTHVEAPTGFSIFLSGFLVKSAIFGFYKFSILIGDSTNTVIFSTFCILGVLDASVKMWGQTDLKKLVAYATIQEMGLIYLVFCWGDTLFIYGGVLFCITHALISSLFFYFVDCVNRRFGSRNITEVNGILHITPNLATAILLGCVIYSGIPGSLKFISELYIFLGLLESSPASCILTIFVANFLGLVGFSKVWFNLVFGLMVLKSNQIPKDLAFKEIYVIFICVFGLFFYGSWMPFIF